MTETQMNSQPEPAHIARATLTLAGVLAGEPDVETRLGVGAALAILNDVHPPYPPHPPNLPAIDPDAGIAATLDALSGGAVTVEEAIRSGLACRELRQLQQAPRPRP